MTSPTRRRTAFIGLAGVSLAAAGFMAPGAFAANTVDGDVTVRNTETVQVLMDASGTIDAQRIYEQIELRGKGKVDLSNPVSTKGLRNLDGFGGFDVRDDKVRIKADVDGVKKLRSVSDFTKELPVDIRVTYKLDGKKVEPGDVVGKSGDLEVRYEVQNMTGKQQDVTFPDGNGDEQSTLNAVVIPMVGSLTTTLPSNFTRVQSDEANAAGDGKGGTQLSFTMTLFPPIGSDRASFGYTSRISEGVVPKASVSMLPVNPLESPSFKGGAASYKGGAESGADLTAGATTIDENVLKLRDGANDLVDGILQLRDGADQLSAGLTNDAAPGANKLAAGAGKLDAGAGALLGGTGDLSAGAGKLNAGAGDLAAGTGKLKSGANDLADGTGTLSSGADDLKDGTGALKSGASRLNQGASDLSDGLATASAGGPELVAGVDALLAGSKQIDAGLTALNGSVVPGANQINGGASALLTALDTQLIGGLDQVNGAITAALNSAADLPASDEKDTITANLNGAQAGLGQVRGGLNTTVRIGLASIRDGSGAIATGVEGATGANGSLKLGAGAVVTGLTTLQTKGAQLAAGLNQLSAGANTLKQGTGGLNAGVGALDAGAGRLSAGAGQLDAGAGKLSAGAGDLNTGAGKLKAGTGDLSAGAGKLNAGAGTLKDGTGQLATGAGALAAGLGTAAAGSGKLADGLGTAAESAPKLPEGAQTLSDQGTSQLVNVGNATASEFGLKYALIEAGSERAATAQPYGSPEGATELTAYKFEIAGEDGAGSANLTRGIAAVALLAAAGGLAAVRRRGMI